MHRSLRDFLATLDAQGELCHVSAPVSPILEISAIADRQSKLKAPRLPSRDAIRTDPRFHYRGGHALLFQNVEGSDIPVLINAWGSYRRMEMALGCDDLALQARQHSLAGPTGFEWVAQRIAELVKPEPPSSLRDAIDKAKKFLPLLKVPPKRRRGSGECQEVVIAGDGVNLTRLPLLRCWPHDGDPSAVGYPNDVNEHLPGLGRGADWESRFRGRYITLGGIHTIHADDRDHPRPPSHNIGMYRVQLLGPRTMAMHWHMHHDGARHWRSWKARGEPMPVAIVLGGESVMPYAATAPLPPGISELLLAGFLNGSGIPMVRAKTVPLWVPANAEIVIEGWVSEEAGGIGWEPGQDGQTRSQRNEPDAQARGSDRYDIGPGAVFEGPFGDHTGFYSLPDRYPILSVSAITHRRDPIYPATVVGLPPQEDYFLGKATERLFLPLLRTLVHDIEDYDLPMFGAFHNSAMLKIDKGYPLQGRRVMHSIWGAGQMAWTKSIFVVDRDVNVHDTMEVLRVAGERCHPTRDVELVRGPVDILDHASPFVGVGAKIGFDATRKTTDAELHQPLEGLASEICATTEVKPAIGADAHATESRLRTLESVLEARIPEVLGGWWLLVRLKKRAAGDGARFIKDLGALADQIVLPPWTIVVGPEAPLSNLDDVLFHWLAHMSPDRDRYLSVCGRRVAFDSTPKLPGDAAHGQPVRRWPPLLAMPPEITARISARWRELGLPGSPDMLPA
jgi:4-hydroxy-3-polyprenylbenzoate decarboxylase